MTHAKLLSSMTQDEFNHWLALESLDPLFDPWIANAINCQTTASTFAKKTPKIENWLPVKPKKKHFSEAQLKASLMHLVVNKD